MSWICSSPPWSWRRPTWPCIFWAMKSRSLCRPPTSKTQVRPRLFVFDRLILEAVVIFRNICWVLVWIEKVIRWPKCTMKSWVTGVLGCPRSCLHAILSLLQRGTEKRSGPVLTQQAPHLAELCYQVFFTLYPKSSQMRHFDTENSVWCGTAAATFLGFMSSITWKLRASD